METLQKYWQKPVVKGAVAVFVVLVAALIIRYGSSNEALQDTESVRTVQLTSAAEVSGSQAITLIGTVRAFTEADITTERAGRVTSVSAELGGTARAGQILATLENASEQAAVLQAQGVYEAALASAAQSSISVSEAETNTAAAKSALVTALKSSYNDANEIIRNDIDDFFGNPDSFVPGLKLDGFGRTQEFNSERIAYQTILVEWQTRSNALSINSDLTSESAYTKQQLNRTINFVDKFLSILDSQENNKPYSETELESFVSNFTAIRGLLLANVAAIENAESAVDRAQDSQKRAQLSASGGGASITDAQVKQALGSLRAAQANLAKTILRSPITGTVNSIDITVGDFVGSFESVAQIANNDALEIVTYVGDFEKEQLVVGDSVLIENRYEGVITSIAPSVDEETRKTEVRIATESPDVTNGDTVRIIKNTVQEVRITEVYVPLSAVKFELENGFILQVTDGKITQKPVVLGSVRGNVIEIKEGLSAEEQFIVDARGLTVGMTVNIAD